MNERDQIYVQIFHSALTQIRDAAQADLVSYCAIETDHIHNLPSLIGESNELRHAHYLDAERALYLERVDRTLPQVQWLLRRYNELWSDLEAIHRENRASENQSS